MLTSLILVCRCWQTRAPFVLCRYWNPFWNWSRHTRLADYFTGDLRETYVKVSSTLHFISRSKINNRDLVWNSFSSHVRSFVYTVGQQNRPCWKYQPGTRRDIVYCQPRMSSDLYSWVCLGEGRGDLGGFNDIPFHMALGHENRLGLSSTKMTNNISWWLCIKFLNLHVNSCDLLN